MLVRFILCLPLVIAVFQWLDDVAIGDRAQNENF